MIEHIVELPSKQSFDLGEYLFTKLQQMETCTDPLRSQEVLTIFGSLAGFLNAAHFFGHITKEDHDFYTQTLTYSFNHTLSLQRDSYNAQFPNHTSVLDHLHFTKQAEIGLIKPQE